MKRILLLLLIAVSFSACEKDDICTEETTPRIVLDFYDISNPANLKNVVNLKVIGEGLTEAVVLNESGTATTKYLANGSSIKLPLKIGENITQTRYRIILNSTGATPNEDMLEFNYSQDDVYVSRACGYKTIFTLEDTNGLLLTDAATPDNLWIQNINIQTNAITTENETHIKIYF